MIRRYTRKKVKRYIIPNNVYKMYKKKFNFLKTKNVLFLFLQSVALISNIIQIKRKLMRAKFDCNLMIFFLNPTEQFETNSSKKRLSDCHALNFTLHVKKKPGFILHSTLPGCYEKNVEERILFNSHCF